MNKIPVKKTKKKKEGKPENMSFEEVMTRIVRVKPVKRKDKK